MSAGGASGDEYWDDDDVGYIALPVPRQDDFVLTELQLSDDEASPTRSAYGYHRFFAHRQALDRIRYPWHLRVINRPRLAR